MQTPSRSLAQSERLETIDGNSNEYRRAIYNPNTKPKPTTAAEHFLSSPNYTADDIPIEKIVSILLAVSLTAVYLRLAFIFMLG